MRTVKILPASMQKNGTLWWYSRAAVPWWLHRMAACAQTLPETQALPGAQRRCTGRYDGGLLACGLPAYEAAPARCICTVPLPTVPLLRLASTECCRMISCPSWAGYLRKTTDKKKRGVSLSAGETPLLTLHHIARTSAHFSSAIGMPSSMFSLRLRCSPMPGQRTSRPGSAGSLDATSAAMASMTHR